MPKLLIVAAAVILLAALPLAAQPNCSLSNVVGTYAVRGQGTGYNVLPGTTTPIPVPLAYVGIASVDYSGALSGKLFGTMGGEAWESSDPSGTMSVKSDCTATMNFKMSVAGQSRQGGFKYLVFDDGDGLLGVTTHNFASNAEKWRRISRLPLDQMKNFTPCTKDMIRGTYAQLYDGIILVTPSGATQPIPVPTVINGTAWFVQAGDLVGKYASNMGGMFAESGVGGPNSARSVKSDCTGSITWSFTGAGAPPGDGQDRFVMLDGGREIWSAPVKAVLGKPVMLGTYRQISVQPPR